MAEVYLRNIKALKLITDKMSSLNMFKNYEFLYDAIEKIYKQVIHWKNSSKIL